MFISHKSNVIQQVADTEWECRRKTKGITKLEYRAWLDSVTTSTGSRDTGDLVETVDYSGETGYTIVGCYDENVGTRLAQLDDYISSSPETGIIYNIKWSDDKVDGSHFIGDDSAKDARLLADEWVIIRRQRDRLLGQTDWMMLSDTGTVSTAWKNYRKALREIPQSQDSAKTFADIDWPDKPSS